MPDLPNVTYLVVVSVLYISSDPPPCPLAHLNRITNKLIHVERESVKTTSIALGIMSPSLSMDGSH